VCNWLGLIDNAAARVNSDNVKYGRASVNSNTVLFYFLSQLPTTFTPWFHDPGLWGFHAYPF